MLTLSIPHLAGALLAGLLNQSGGGGGTPSFDGTWTFTVDGQTVQADADGNFTLSNVAAPDSFGAGGPGTLPDFVSDHWLRVFGTSAAGAEPLYAVSAPFKFTAGETFLVQGFTLTTTPPGLVQANEITLATPVLTQLGQTTQATVIGTLSDGVSTVDVTQLFTDFTTSNPSVATVDAAGIVTAAGPGKAFIAAVTDGAIAVADVDVSLGDPLTTVVGFIVLEDGTPVAGADVSLIEQAGSDVSGADGSFSIPGVAATLGPVSVTASASVGGTTYSGSSGALEPVPGGVTDLGLVTLASPQGVLVWDEFFLTSDTLSLALNALGYDVTVSASLPLDLSPYNVIYHHATGAPGGTPIHPLTPNEQAQLAAFVNAGFGLHLTAASGTDPLVPVQHDSLEALINMLVIGPKPTIGFPTVINPQFNPGAVGGITTVPNPLTIWCPFSCPITPGMTGIPWSDPHAFVRNQFGGGVAGAVWDCSDMLSGSGRVTLMITKISGAHSSVLPLLLQNMQLFFSGASTCP